MTDLETVPPPDQSPERAPRRVDEAGEALWVRALYMVLFAVVAHVLLTLVVVAGAAQFVVFLVSRAPNEELRGLSRGLVRYLATILDYLTFLRNERPFPFAPFPKPGAAAV